LSVISGEDGERKNRKFKLNKNLIFCYRVIPAKAGIQSSRNKTGFRLCATAKAKAARGRRNDTLYSNNNFMDKKNLVLVGILAALILFSWAWNGPIKNWQTNRGVEKNFLIGVNLADATKVEIEKSKNIAVLEKSGERWRVGGTKDFYAPAASMEEMAAVLDKAANGHLELASSNKDKKVSFGFDDPSQVKITQGEKVYEFLIGKATDDFTGSYVSLADSDKVYRLAGNLTNVFANKDWRDGQIFSFSKDRANKVRFQYGKTQFTVEKKDNKWAGVSPKKFTVSEEKLNKVLTVLENLRSADIPAQDFAGTGLEKNGLIIQVIGEGFDNILMVGNCTKDKLCYAKRGDSDNIYFITQEQKIGLTKKMSDLK
jgi:hypothetical protein